MHKLLSRRAGPRPQTSAVPPHLQLDQWPPPSVFAKLIEWSLQLKAVNSRQARMASPETRALWLLDDYAHGPADAFIDDHEFCHINALPEGSLRVTLPDGPRQRILELGWAEQHLMSRSGVLPPTLVMVYAPRNDEELEGVSAIVKISYEFARGGFSNSTASTL